MQPDGSRAATFSDRVGSRLNPVLVKEVRSALRGRAFTIGFVLVLVLAMVASSIALVVSTIDGQATASGMAYLVAVGLVFALGSHGFVPFSAMSSMSSEHDEGSLELLQLSGISAGRLVIGKLGAAAVQAALIYSAFLPFLAFAFLLEGVDIGMLMASVATAFLASMAFSAFGILLGSVCRQRWLRVFGYVFLAVALMVGVQSLFGWIAFGMFTGAMFSVFDLAWSVSLVVFGMALCIVLATARLQHAEENRSTAFRVLGTAALVVLCALGVAAGSPDDALPWLLSGLGFALPSLYLGVTESNRLPRAVLARVRVRGTRWYAAPWMPGGGRAVLLVFVDCAVVLAAAALVMVRTGTAHPEAWRTIAALFFVEAWLFVVLLLPSGIAGSRLEIPWVRAVTRIVTMALPILLLLVPAFVMFLSGSTVGAFDHAGNPRHFARSILNSGALSDRLGAALLLVFALLALVLNLPRVVASLSEARRRPVQAASALHAEA